MATKRYGYDKKYSEFVTYARNGDKILRQINNRIIKYSKLKADEMFTLNSVLNSNTFISKFKVPFSYKLDQISGKPSVPKRGDIVEAYIWWRYTNYGLESAERYVEDQIIKVTSKIK